MRKAAFSVVLALGACSLSSCSWIGGWWQPMDPQERPAELRLAQMNHDVGVCAAKRNAAASTSHVQYSLCVNTAFQAAMTDIAYPHPDIVASLSAERLRVADQLDNGSISEAEGLARISDKISEMMRLQRARSGGFGEQTAPVPPQYFLQLMQVGL